MGVCCIVFDIDGMLFEFCMNFLNIKIFFFQYFMFSSRFMLFPTLKKNNTGRNVFFMFFLYAGNIEKCPFTYSYWLNGRWFLQIVDKGHFIMRLEIFKSAPFTCWLNGGGGFSKS